MPTPVPIVGPCRILTASAVTEPPENWTDLGDTRGGVEVTPEFMIATGFTDQSGETPRADAYFRLGGVTRARAPLVDHSLATLSRVAPGSLITTAGGQTSLAYGSGVSIITPRAFAFVP